MKNITIKTSMYDKADTRAGFRSFSATIDEKDLITIIGGNIGAVDFIEQTISKAISQAIGNGEGGINITVTVPEEIKLTEVLKTHLVDKFQADELVISVTFK